MTKVVIVAGAVVLAGVVLMLTLAGRGPHDGPPLGWIPGPHNSGPPQPVPSSVLSQLHLRATPIPAGSANVVSQQVAIDTARRWLVKARAWRPNASTGATLVRLADMGLHDEPAWLVYVSGVRMSWARQPHVLVVIDGVTGKRRGNYSF